MAYPFTPLSVVVELFYSSAWQDITSYVLRRDGIDLRRGFPDEGTSPEPGSMTLTLNNRDGRFSPRNPTSPLYGLIGRNTPIRVRVNESTIVTGDRVRFVGEVSEWPPRWDVSGRDVWVPVTAQGILRRLGQGEKPLRSPLTSSILPLAESFTTPFGYWPMEEAAGATSFAPGATSGSRMTWSGTRPDLAAIGPLVGSDKLPVLASTTALSGPMPATVASRRSFGAIAAIDVPSTTGWADNTPIFWLDMPVASGVFRRWELRYKSGSGGDLQLRVLNDNGSLLVDDSGTLDMNIDGKTGYLSMSASSPTLGGNGDITWLLTLGYLDDNGNLVTTSQTGTFTTPSMLHTPNVIQIAPSGGLAELAIAHVLVNSSTVQAGSTTAFPDDGLASYAGETAGDRATRVCDEASIPFAIVGDPDDTELMGEQPIPSSFFDIYNESWATDLALAYETRDDLELSWRTRASLHNQTVGLELSYTGAGEVAPNLEPTDDDQNVHNDVEVKRKNGSNARAVDSTSLMGTQAPPLGIGRYDTSVELSLFSDEQCLQQAGWRLHVGHWDALRFPAIHIDMAALAKQGKTTLMANAAALDVGDRIRITNPPAWLPPDAADLMVLGFAETVGHPVEWSIVLVCVPYGPYDVGTLASDTDAGLLNTRGCTTAEALDTTETGVDVTNTDDGWSSTGVPYDITIGGERMTVTAVSGTGTSQTLTVTRSVNGVVKSHSTAANVLLVHPLRLVL